MYLTENPKLINLAERVLQGIVDEKAKGMEPAGVVISTDDYATMCLETGVAEHTIWWLPIEHSGTLPSTAFILTSAGIDN